MTLNLPRVPLALLPTPLHRLERLSNELGLDLWIKRDDLTGFALGGNKARKLEFLIADAVRQGAEVVVSCGSGQSNFLRQLAAACAMTGLRSAAAVMALPFEGAEPDAKGLGNQNGNVLLDELFGMELRWIANGTWDELFAEAETLASEIELEGKRVYRIPVGGSSWLGAYAFYLAALELQGQGPPFDTVVTASSSGSTQVGLAYGFAGTGTAVLGIACDPEPELPNDFAALASELDTRVGLGVRLGPSDFRFDLNYVGAGYGIPSEAGDAAIQLLARTEGIVLDPIYSGKAFAGLLEQARAGRLAGRICFWHTGGTPALFADG